ncbi:hypothetical protein H0194_09260 [Corynebacterium incognita]|uniref:Uncharacterized protein n=1 Tax=Corynebacterium incognita TaxID=2754725 RepID=A0A7G7CNR4_9CORY|nr:DUF6882 domain-containing protein [Corynebacterium incognita]QNE89230.1 hypothetical protein H0194_09260 [Corynebacterium incognita]
MVYSPPESLDDVVIDGLLSSSAHDAAFHRQVGPITGVEFNGGTADTTTPDLALDIPVDVRIHGPNHTTTDFTGTVIAHLTTQSWEWTTSRVNDLAGLGIAELRSGSQPYTPLLVAAARTLCGGQPVVLRAGDEHRPTQLIVVNSDAPLPPVHAATTNFLAELPSRGFNSLPQVPRTLRERNEWRAVMAYAAQRGLSAELVTNTGSHPGSNASPTGRTVAFGDGSRVTFQAAHPTRIAAATGNENALSLADIQADAFYFAAEHEMLLDARFPRPEAHVSIPESSFALRDGAAATRGPAALIATCTADTWTWAWADPFVAHLPIARAAHRIKDFATQQGIADLIRPQLSLDDAEASDLINVTKPILQWWTHLSVELGPHPEDPTQRVRGIVLINPPELRAPAGPADVAARAKDTILAIPTPPGIDAHRARRAYERFRDAR